MTARTPQQQRLIDLLDPVVSAEGYDLEDVSVTAAGRRSLIRVTVDGDDGIDLDSVAAVARSVSEALDDESSGPAAFAGPYVLEVSSPGVDRPLSELRHWRRANGRLVTVALVASGEQLTGRVVAVSEADGCTIELDTDGTRRTHPLSALGPGRIQVEFSHGSGVGVGAADVPDGDPDADFAAELDTDEYDEEEEA